MSSVGVTVSTGVFSGATSLWWSWTEHGLSTHNDTRVDPAMNTGVVSTDPKVEVDLYETIAYCLKSVSLVVTSDT